MNKFYAFISLLYLCSVLGTSLSRAQAIPAEEFQNMDLDELERELKAAKYFADLNRASFFINGSERCGTFLDDASESLQNMRQIRADSAGQVTEAIQRAYQEEQDKNQVALFDYRSCFTRNMAGYPELTEVGITTYETHKTAFDRTKDNYSNVPDIYNYIAALENAIENYTETDEGDFIGELANVHNTVDVLQGGRGSEWKTVSRGYKLRVKDELRTGPRGRTRILFADRYNAGNAGPTVINIGSGSQIRIEDFTVNLTAQANRRGIISLIRGKMRAFTRGWGFGSSFQVRTGASIASSGGTAINIGGDTQIGTNNDDGLLRQIGHYFQKMFMAYAQSNTGVYGTEVAIEYFPDTDLLNVHLNRGNAVILFDGEQIPMEPNTGRTVAFGNISPVRTVREDVWNSFVRETGDGYVETAQTLGIENAEPIESLIKPNESYTNDRYNAEFHVWRLLESMSTYDRGTFSRLASGQLRNSYDESMKTKTFREFIDFDGQRPKTWTPKCSVCWIDADGTKVCQVQIFVEADNPDQNKDLLFWLYNIDAGDLAVTINRASLAEGVELSSFNSHNPVCFAQ